MATQEARQSELYLESSSRVHRSSAPPLYSWATHRSHTPGMKQAPLEVNKTTWKKLISLCLQRIGHLHLLLLSLDADSREELAGQGGSLSILQKGKLRLRERGLTQSRLL